MNWWLDILRVLSRSRHCFCSFLCKKYIYIANRFIWDFHFHVSIWDKYYKFIVIIPGFYSAKKKIFKCNKLMHQTRVVGQIPSVYLEPSFIVWKQYNCLISGAHSAICFANKIFFAGVWIQWKHNPELRVVCLVSLCVEVVVVLKKNYGTCWVHWSRLMQNMFVKLLTVVLNWNTVWIMKI